MTPDLTTPEGRAELRALIDKAQPGPWFLEKQRGYCDTYVKTAHPDWAPTEKGPHKNFIAEFGLGNEPTGHFYDQNAEMVCAVVNGISALLDILDAAYTAFEGRPGPNTLAEIRERMVNDPEYRADFWRRVAESERNMLDVAYAQIERLTAPVTEEEARKAIELYNGSPNNDASDLYDMRGVLDAFIASRKEPAP
jgi:hypothetical protein